MTVFDFLLDTYETERLKTLSIWSVFTDADLEFCPAPRARTPHEQMVHQCTSEDGWLKGMLGIDTGLPALPAEETRLGFLRHYAELSQRRLDALRQKEEPWFNERSMFFDAERTRSWILLRRLTHSAHHRAQLVVYLRLLGRPIYSTYGPTADTGGLPINDPRVIYRYRDVADLLAAEREGGRFRDLPGPGNKPPTERPGAAPLLRSLERVPLRVRGNGPKLSAWRMTVDSGGGAGVIVMADDFYRGEGMYSGLSQEELAAEYRRLNPPQDPIEEFTQLG